MYNIDYKLFTYKSHTRIYVYEYVCVYVNICVYANIKIKRQLRKLNYYVFHWFNISRMYTYISIYFSLMSWV